MFVQEQLQGAQQGRGIVRQFVRASGPAHGDPQLGSSALVVGVVDVRHRLAGRFVMRGSQAAQLEHLGGAQLRLRRQRKEKQVVDEFGGGIEIHAMPSLPKR